MRLSAVFLSSICVLAGISTALHVERRNMLSARFANFDFQLKSRGEPMTEDYDHTAAVSTNGYKSPPRHRRSFYGPPRYVPIRRRNDGSQSKMPRLRIKGNPGDSTPRNDGFKSKIPRPRTKGDSNDFTSTAPVPHMDATSSQNHQLNPGDSTTRNDGFKSKIPRPRTKGNPDDSTSIAPGPHTQSLSPQNRQPGTTGNPQSSTPDSAHQRPDSPRPITPPTPKLRPTTPPTPKLRPPTPPTPRPNRYQTLEEDIPSLELRRRLSS